MRFDTSNLAAFQNDFLWAITTSTVSYDAGLAIHRDTYFFGLLDGLCAIYEATVKSLGDEAFKAFARDFIRACPLTSGDRNGYGAGLADFMQLHPHLQAAWLPDLMRFEWALHEAHHARDADPADFATLLMPQARIALHPSTRILTLSHDIKDMHAALITGSEPPAVRAIPCNLLIGRDRDETAVWLCLAPYEAGFIDLIVRHALLTAALERLQPNEDDMRVLQDFLARLVGRGLLITL